jgi:hypothetical protein
MSVTYIQSCFNRAKAQGASHMIMVCDTFDYEDYPVFVQSDLDVREEVRRMDGKNMQRVMEVYKISLGWEAQSVGIVFNY